MDERKIKVCMLVATLERGGAEKQLAMLAAGLDRDRFTPAVVALRRGGPVEEELDAAGVPCEVLGFRGKAPLAGLCRLKRILRRSAPDIVHTWMFTANAYGRVAARWAGGCRVVIGERCVDKWKGRGRLAVDRFLVRWTDAVVANSPSVAHWLADVGIPESLVRVIPNAFDPRGYRTRPPGAAGKFGDAPRLVSVGRLNPQKRFDVAIHAMTDIVQVFPGATLTIAGEGPSRPRLEALAQQLGLADHIKMPGRVDDVPRLLLDGDAFLFASDFEGMPNAVMEAMYVGLPVVAVAAPGVTDVVEDGVTGILTPPGDGPAMAQGAIDLLRDPDRIESIVGQARARITDRHKVEDMVRAYEDLYAALVQPGESGDGG